METSGQTASTAALTPFAARLGAVEYRLRRCLEDVTHAPPPLASASSGEDVAAHGAAAKQWARVRQLGVLTSSAVALLDDMAVAERSVGQNAPVAERSAGDWASPEEAADSAAFYAARLLAQYSALTVLVQQARDQLCHYAARDPAFCFPLSCIGAEVHVGIRSDEVGVADVRLVDDNRLSAARTRIPVAHVETVRGSVQLSAAAPRATVPEAATPVPSASTTASASAEDAVVDDIKRAVQQMKEGALHMGELMRGEEEGLRTSEALMMGGLHKVQQSAKDVDILSGGTTGRAAPSFLNALPGGAMVWQHVVLPLWDVAKQALLMSLVIAVTGSVVMLMLIASKPQRLRLKH